MDIGDRPTRVGVLTPHATPGADAELPEMAPGLVRVGTARIRAAVPGVGVSRPRTPAGDLRAQVTPEALDEAAAALLPAVDVLAVASTSLGYALGHAAEYELVGRLRARWGVPVCTTSLSVVSALRSRHVQRISLVHPPWFGQSLHDLGSQYFRGQGFDVVDARLAPLPDDPDQVEPAMVVEYVAQHLCSRADAVVIGGNGFRAARAIDALEARTGRLVLEANQVLLWSVLRSVGAPTIAAGFGRLLGPGESDGHTTNER